MRANNKHYLKGNYSIENGQGSVINFSSTIAKKGGKMRVVIICICTFIAVIAILILLNYIPIKYAVKIEYAKMMAENKDYFICETNRVAPDIGWYADTEFNVFLDSGLQIRVNGSSPEQYLSAKIFDFKYYETYNQFLLLGDLGKIIEDKESLTKSAELNVKEWQIIYPIRREGWIRKSASSEYLTIYDYDWIKALKSFLQQGIQ